MDFVDENIVRLEDLLNIDTNNMWSERFRTALYNKTFEQDYSLGSIKRYGNSIMVNGRSRIPSRNIKRLIDMKKDLTGYVDKDLE